MDRDCQILHDSLEDEDDDTNRDDNHKHGSLKDNNREHRRLRLDAFATFQLKPQDAGHVTCWDDVNDGKLDAKEVQKARQLGGGVHEQDETCGASRCTQLEQARMPSKSCG